MYIGIEKISGTSAFDETGARPLKNAQFRSRSRRVRILTAGIYQIFRGLKSERNVPPTGGRRKRVFFKGLGV